MKYNLTRISDKLPLVKLFYQTEGICKYYETINLNKDNLSSKNVFIFE